MDFFRKKNRMDELQTAVRDERAQSQADARRLSDGLAECREKVAALSDVVAECRDKVLGQSDGLAACSEEIGRLAGETAQNGGAIRQLSESSAKLLEEQQRLMRRQSASLEDILEELQRRKETDERVAEQIRGLEEREDALLELSCALADQKEMILQSILADGSLPADVRTGWQRQAQLMALDEQKLERACAIERIGRAGDRVDYDTHEIISVEPTDDEAKNETVARVFSAGCSYHGEIRKKARVSVYKFEKSADLNRLDGGI